MGRAGILQNWKIKPEAYQQTKFCINQFIASTHVTIYEIQQLYDAEKIIPTVLLYLAPQLPETGLTVQQFEGDKLRIVLFWKISLLYHAIHQTKQRLNYNIWENTNQNQQLTF